MHSTYHHTRHVARLVLLITIASPATRAAGQVVISQIWGGGGNIGAVYTHDFVELFNRGSSPVSLAGWSVPYASFGGNFLHGINLADTIQPGGYYLVQAAPGNGCGAPCGLPLPAWDASGPVQTSSTNGKVALVADTGLIGSSCSAASVVDLVGYGPLATGQAPVLDTGSAAHRDNNGCIDTDDNAADFVRAAPAPRNSATPPYAINGDMNRDGHTDGRDIQPFVAAVIAGSTVPADLCAGDLDRSGLVDAGDVALFVDVILSS